MTKSEEVKLGECFYFISGNGGLTEEFIYDNQASTIDSQIPIFSGSTIDENPIGLISEEARPHGKSLKVYRGPALLVVRKGKAGKMVFQNCDRFAINDDVYLLKPKIDYENKVDLRWFMYQYQSLFYNLSTSKSDNSTFNKDYAERQKVILPDINIQRIQSEAKLNAERMKVKNKILLDRIRTITKHTVLPVSGELSIPLSHVFEFLGGNTGLTEEFVYNNLPISKEDEIPILSGATMTTNQMGIVSEMSLVENNKQVYEGECILVSRNGYAGTMKYISKGKFTINDHAYVIKVKAPWKEKINLRWFVYQYQGMFYNLVTSKSDNATFSKDYCEKQKILLPNKSAQDQIANKLLLSDAVVDTLEKVNAAIDALIYSIYIEENFLGGESFKITSKLKHQKKLEEY
jgi:hypothetical protein